ncbi:hypothetical protein B0H19DRAFT_1080180 [Mycena capillaripes]|nr:hypothetical protein B0H19DRAFT_1080180 [Mycena capillaripes]
MTFSAKAQWSSTVAAPRSQFKRLSLSRIRTKRTSSPIGWVFSASPKRTSKNKMHFRKVLREITLTAVYSVIPICIVYEASPIKIEEFDVRNMTEYGVGVVDGTAFQECRKVDR